MPDEDKDAIIAKLQRENAALKKNENTKLTGHAARKAARKEREAERDRIFGNYGTRR